MESLQGRPCFIKYFTFFCRYYSITSNGASSLSFNATSVQNMVILGLLLLVLGALILPLFGINILGEEVTFKLGVTTLLTRLGHMIDVKVK